MAMLNSAPTVSGLVSHSANRKVISPATSHQPLATPRRGLTLVEMLISLACVILLMLAYTQLFADAGARINDSRAAIDMTNRLRSAAQRLRDDFAGITVEMLPWQRPESGAGYFEIIEGFNSDPPPPLTGPTYRNNGNTSNPTFPVGDTDDGLMMTVRSKGAPFIGKYQGNTVQSEVAEVVWFLRPTTQPDPTNAANPAMSTNPPTYTLYRRVFLVMPTYAGVPTTFSGVTVPGASDPIIIPPRIAFYDRYDVSARVDGNRFVANTLADLTKRECRYGHIVRNNATFGFPHSVDTSWMMPFGVSFNGTNYFVDTSHPRYGEDAVLTNVLAFDVQVWDPTAPVYVTGTAPNEVSVAPGDPGFAAEATLSGTPQQYPLADSLGAYVDLNWANAALGSIFGVLYPNNSTTVPLSPLYSTGHTRSQLVASGSSIPATYDTGSFHYEHDGLDQDTALGADQGTNGFDDDSQYGVDDTGYINPMTGAIVSDGERETSPPYPVPLRGIKVRIRVYEPDTRQIREVSVVHSFVPE
jgi:hypothetical protein